MRLKVFISSLIDGYERYRDAVRVAVEMLHHEVIRAEDFPASSISAQQACLAGVRAADVVVLLMGERYGPPQNSGISATHEEYREARERKPVLVFVESAVTRDSAQQQFLDEVEAWATGHVRKAFSTPENLRDAVVRALHDYELANAAGSVDVDDLLTRARALVPTGQGIGSSPRLALVVACGPHQQVIRPAEMEDPSLARDLQREALFGDHAVLDPSEGTTTNIRSDALVLEQQSASILVDRTGSIRIIQPAHRERGWPRSALPTLIEEDIAEALARALRFSAASLDRVDPLFRLTDVTALAHVTNAGYLSWRTREEQAASPNAGQMHMGGEGGAVALTPPRRSRQALTHDAERIADDFTVLLRQQRRQ